MFDNLVDSLNNAPYSSILDNLKTAAPQRSTRNRVNQVDFKKFFQK